MEIWKDVNGYEGLYQVSNLGKIRSVERVDRLGRKVHGRLLKQHKGRGTHQYMTVGISKDGEGKRVCVHVLVARSFCDNPNSYNVVNHIDEDKCNNCAENLEWTTYKGNANHGTIRDRTRETIERRKKNNTYIGYRKRKC